MVGLGTKTIDDDGVTHMDYSYNHYEVPAHFSGVQTCSMDLFEEENPEEADNQACFCEGPIMFDSFCDNTGVETYVGCYEDEEYDRDFEELLSSSIYSP
jgi:hypothetical protein